MNHSDALQLATQWTNEILEFPSVTKLLRERLSHVLEMSIDDDYSGEKLIKCFAEPIYYLSSLYHQEAVRRIGADYRGGILISPQQIEIWRKELPVIEERLLGDIRRLDRHFRIFIAGVVKS
jgi:hypothetical protein